MSVAEALERRRSIKHFDATRAMSDEELRALLSPMRLVPTSFNLQHGRFVAVRDPKKREELSAAAFGQPQVKDCSCVVLIVADVNAHESAEALWAGAPQTVIEGMSQMIRDFYGGKPTLQRDESIRSGSLAAMALMLLAAEQGWDSCPLIGFDPHKVRDVIAVPDGYICVLMIAIGHATQPAYPRVGRLDLGELARLETFDGASLSEE